MRGELLDLAAQVGVELGRLFAHEALLGLALCRDDAVVGVDHPAAETARIGERGAQSAPAQHRRRRDPGPSRRHRLPGAPGPGTPGPGAPGPCGVLVTAGASRGWP
ncbi:hypothetical protein [Microbacterium lacticum]